MNGDDCRTEPNWWRDDDLRGDIYDDDHGTGRDWTPPHGIERPYKSDYQCPECDGTGRQSGERCRRCKGTGHR